MTHKTAFVSGICIFTNQGHALLTLKGPRGVLGCGPHRLFKGLRASVGLQDVSEAYRHAPGLYLSALSMPRLGRLIETIGRVPADPGACEPTDHRGDRGGARRQQTGALRRAQKKGSPADSASARDPRGTAATYSPGWWASTIGADELNGSVRDGKRWDLIALTTAAISLERPQSGFRGKDIGPLVRVGFAIAGFTPPAYQRRRLRRPSSEVSSWRRLRA